MKDAVYYKERLTLSLNLNNNNTTQTYCLKGYVKQWIHQLTKRAGRCTAKGAPCQLIPRPLLASANAIEMAGDSDAIKEVVTKFVGRASQFCREHHVKREEFPKSVGYGNGVESGLSCLGADDETGEGRLDQGIHRLLCHATFNPELY